MSHECTCCSFVFFVLTLTENVGESITEKGQEPIVQVSLRDIP